ncbi:uncharacterized protein [Watersipora subatra]|uniref:uncharacterized protein n=1 Tax=Watersipora subatra TaxID=2589382 RepID=UPI00355BB287
MATDVKFMKDDGSKLANACVYQSMVGSLLYAASATHPDISHAVGVLSRYNSSPTETHMTAVKRVLRYLKGSIDICLHIEKHNIGELFGYTDASWADNCDNRHSTSGLVFMHGGTPVSWFSKSQSIVAVSTAEAEYVALYDAAREATWLRQLYDTVTNCPTPAINVYVDNQSTITIANSGSNTKRTKHIDIKYHYCREAITNGVIVTSYCPTEKNIADIFTKPLTRPRFEELHKLLVH